MKYPFTQSSFDSLCGVFSIINAERIVNNSTEEESQFLFNSIINYLSKKKKLKGTLIGGMYKKDVIEILDNVILDRFRWRLLGNGFSTLDEWWSYSKTCLEAPEKNATIVSFGGALNHFSVIKEMTDKTMLLSDSSWINKIRKSNCKLIGYTKTDKYIIYPSQCIYCWKD